MDILNVYHEAAPASRFVGKQYSEADRKGGSFAAYWEEWFKNGWFERLEALAPYGWDRAFPEGLSYIGLMRGGETSFEYWIGMFLPEGTTVPQGMEHLDVSAWHMGVCWVKGREPEIYHQGEACLERLTAAGYQPLDGESGWLMLERYQCPRFTTPDSDGQVILDVIHKIAEPAKAEDEASDAATPDLTGWQYCGGCYLAFSEDTCPECGERGTPLRADDPILIGMLPARLRNAMQIAFAATGIPFTAIPTMGSGFTMAAGDMFETYTVYAPYERARDAADAMEGVLGFPPERPEK